MVILSLLTELNNYTSEEILIYRREEMAKRKNYKCVGMYINNVLVGISGLWFLVRHYFGKNIAPDHFVISSAYRNKGLGKLLFEWIYNYAQKHGYEASELNTYIENKKSHKFYENEGYKKLGFHYLKKF